LSLCLRIDSLQQSPSTTDFHCFAVACQSGIAALAASGCSLFCARKKGASQDFTFEFVKGESSNLPSYQNNAKISFFLSAEFEIKKGGNPLVF